MVVINFVKITGGSWCGRPKVGDNNWTYCPGKNDKSRLKNNTCANLPINNFCNKKENCFNKACGHPGTLNVGKICCPSGERYQINEIGDSYCTGGNSGDLCFTTKGCADGLTCGHPSGSKSNPTICCPNGAYLSFGNAFCAKQKPGSMCENNRGCASGNCSYGVCKPHAKNKTAQYIITIIIVIAVIILLIIIGYIVMKF